MQSYDCSSSVSVILWKHYTVTNAQQYFSYTVRAQDFWVVVPPNKVLIMLVWVVSLHTNLTHPKCDEKCFFFFMKTKMRTHPKSLGVFKLLNNVSNLPQNFLKKIIFLALWNFVFFLAGWYTPYRTPTPNKVFAIWALLSYTMIDSVQLKVHLVLTVLCGNIMFLSFWII